MSAGTMEYGIRMTGGSAFAAGLRAAASEATNLAGALKGQLIGSIASVGAALGAGMSVSWFANGIRSALEAGDQLNRLSQQTGQTAEDMLKLARAGKEADLDMTGIAGATNRLQAALSGVNEMGESTAATFAALGVNVESMRGMTAVQQFQSIHDGLAKINSQADKVKLLRNLFGKEGAAMLPMFNEVSNFGAPLSAAASLLAKNAETFDRVTKGLEKSGNVVKGFFYGVADRVAPVLLPLLDRFNKIDLSGYGQQIGNVFATLANAFKGGQLGEMIGLSLKVGFMTSVDFFASALVGTVTMFANMIVPIIGLIGRIWTSGSFGEALAESLMWSVAKFSEAFTKCLREPLSWLAATFGWIAQQFGAAIVAIWNPIARGFGMRQLEVKDKRTFDQILKESDANLGGMAGNAKAVADQSGAAASERVKEAVAGVGAGIDAIITKGVAGFKTGMGSISIFGDAKNADIARLKALGDKFAPKDGTSDAASSLAGAGAAAAGGGDGGRKPQVDEWQKVGLIVGNGGAAANRAADKTAKHTEETVRVLNSILGKIGSTTTSSPTAVYGV